MVDSPRRYARDQYSVGDGSSQENPSVTDRVYCTQLRRCFRRLAGLKGVPTAETHHHSSSSSRLSTGRNFCVPDMWWTPKNNNNNNNNGMGGNMVPVMMMGGGGGGGFQGGGGRRNNRFGNQNNNNIGFGGGGQQRSGPRMTALEEIVDATQKVQTFGEIVRAANGTPSPVSGDSGGRKRGRDEPEDESVTDGVCRQLLKKLDAAEGKTEETMVDKLVNRLMGTTGPNP